MKNRQLPGPTLPMTFITLALGLIILSDWLHLSISLDIPAISTPLTSPPELLSPSMAEPGPPIVTKFLRALPVLSINNGLFEEKTGTGLSEKRGETADKSAEEIILPPLNDNFLRTLAYEAPAVDKRELEQILKTTWKVCREEKYHFMRALAQMRAESDFNPRLVSSAGAVGLMQILPETARDMGFKDISSLEDNIRCGIRYMKYLDRFAADHHTARERWLATLACYNSGPGHYIEMLARTKRRTGGDVCWLQVSRTYRRRFRRARGSNLPETLIYVRRNLDTLGRFHSKLFQICKGPSLPLEQLTRIAPETQNSSLAD